MTVLSNKIGLVLVVLATLFCALVLIGDALASDESYKSWAEKWHKEALKQRSVVLKGTEALKRKEPLPVPEYVDSYRVWGQTCKNMATYWKTKKIPSQLRRLNNPTGTGPARWWPTARYVGWPSAQKRNVITCIRYESYGNPYDGPCIGIMQIHPVHAVKFKKVTGVSVWDSRKDSVANLRFSLYLWRGSGWGPWQAMRGRY